MNSMDHKKLSRHAKAHSLHDIQRMLASFEDDILPNIASKDEILHRARQRQLKKKAAGASALALCGLLLGTYCYNPAYQQYELATARGEQASIRLRDGSQIMLNTDSHVRVQERLRSREITLSRGEAGFHVAHAEHPLLRRFERSFQVSAGEMLIIVNFELPVNLQVFQFGILNLHIKVGIALEIFKRRRQRRPVKYNMACLPCLHGIQISKGRRAEAPLLIA